MLRRDPKLHSKYTAYGINDILQTLGVSSAVWAAVAVVSGNDFYDNIYGQGMARNVECLRYRANSPVVIYAGVELRHVCT